MSHLRLIIPVSLNIKQSKTDPFRKGSTIKIWANKRKLCPVTALRIYCLQGRHGGPLFRFSNGTYLTRSNFSHILQQCIPEINLNTHSFCIGGASTAHAAGVSDSTIQTLGRWSSNAFQLYLRIPDCTIQQAHSIMSQTTYASPWYPKEEQGKGKSEEK